MRLIWCLALTVTVARFPTPAAADPNDPYAAISTLSPPARLDLLLNNYFDSVGEPNPRANLLLLRLLKSHPDLLSRVTARLRPETAELTPHLVEILGRVGDRSVTPALLSLLPTEDTDLRLAVSRAIRWMLDPAATETSLALLRDPEKSIRQNAAFALGRMGGSASLEPLIHAMEDHDRLVRHEATRSLGILADPQSVPDLLRTAKESPDRFLRDVAGKALCQIQHPDAIRFMEDAWKNGSTRVRAAALEGLARFRGNEGFIKLATHDENPWIRQQALGIWVTLYPRDAPKPLLELIRSDERGLGITASRCLVDLDVAAYVVELLHLLGEPLPAESRGIILWKLLEAVNPGRVPQPEG